MTADTLRAQATGWGVVFTSEQRQIHQFINDFKGELNGLIELSLSEVKWSLSEINVFNKAVSCTWYVIYSDGVSSSLLLCRERSVQLLWVS